MEQLLNGDCLELMKKIPDGTVDMILCDMPYGTTRNRWDTIIDLEKIWEQYRRITKPNAAIVLFSQVPFSAVLGASNLKMLKYEWIWDKGSATGFLNSRKMPLKRHENILVFYDKLPTYNPQFTYKKSYSAKCRRESENYNSFTPTATISKDGKRYPTDIYKMARETGLHPTQKPVKLLEYLIKTYTNKGETVLDNCMGSGSTGVACVNTGRNFISMELDKGYFDIAKKRIEEAKANVMQK